MSRIRAGVVAIAAAALLSLSMMTGAVAQEVTPETPTTSEATAPPADATTPSPEASETAPAPTESPVAQTQETGRIIFFRPSRLSGGAYAYTIREVGEDGHVAEESPRIGRLRNGSYFEYSAPAGIHNYNISGPMAVNKAEDRLRMEVEAGETYYVEQTVRMGLITGGFRLIPANQARFEEHPRLRPSPQEEN